MTIFRNILVYLDADKKNGALLKRASKLAQTNQATLTIVDVVPKFQWPAKLILQNYQHIEELLVQEKHEKLQKLVAHSCPHEIRTTTKVLAGRSSVEIIHEVLRGDHDLVLCRSKGTRSNQKGPLGTTALKLLRHCPSAVWLFSEDTGLKIRRVLVAVDPMAADDSHAEINDRLLKIASSIHQTEKCDLFVVHAWSLFGEQILRSRLTPSQIDELRAAERQEAEKSLSRLVSQYELPQASDNIFLKEGNPAAVIRELVKDKNIDLLMMGTIAHGGVAGFMMGNTAEAVFNRVDCSILAVKPKTFVSPIHPDDDRREQTKPATDERAQELQQH